jgi:glycosyltransferase involved in cell wall biosynthesis
MRVALFLGRNVSKSMGGTYSFEQQLLCALADLKDFGEHEFFVFGWNQDIPLEIFSATHIHFVGELKDPQSNHFFKFTKLAYKKIFKANRNLSSINKLKVFAKKHLSQNSSNIIAYIIAHKIDITWSLGLDCPFMDIPFIATVWDLIHRVQPYFPEVCVDGYWLQRESFYAETLRRATYIVTGTQVGKTEVERFYNVPPDRIKVIPFATPKFALEAPQCTDSDRIHILKKYSITQEYLFYPAQFWPHKNHIGLLLALKYLKDDYNISFSIVFAGSNQGNLTFIQQKVDEFSLSEQVKFLGFVSSEDLTLLYQNAFALTYVTFAGPDNLPPLEAFGLGCPVIASRVSGAEEQLGKAAMLVDPRKYKDIALAIRALKENPDLRQTFVERGLVRAVQWTGKDYIREICSILDEFAPIRRCWSSDEIFKIDT